MDLADYVTRMIADIRIMRQQIAAMRAEIEGVETVEDELLQECEI